VWALILGPSGDWPCISLRVWCSDGSQPKTKVTTAHADEKGFSATIGVAGCPAGPTSLELAKHVLDPNDPVCDDVPGNAPYEATVTADGTELAACTFTIQGPLPVR
jgi:hypothetical protein